MEVSEFSSKFMGHVGFEDLKKHCRHGDDFCKEMLAVLSERAALELTYSKTIKKFSQRLAKACSNAMYSPLFTAWRTIYSEMDKEADMHRKYSSTLQEDCVKATAILVENQAKIRKSLEVNVDSASRVMSDKLAEHTKQKKRHHQLYKDFETQCDLVDSSRPKTEKDQLKVVMKHKRAEELLSRCDEEYYDALLEFQRRKTEWEIVSRDSCDKIKEMEESKLDHICRMAMTYSVATSNVSQQLAHSCQQIKASCDNLDPSGEIRILLEGKKASYQSEQYLCDYYDENFKNRIKLDRRVESLTKSVGRFLGDLQKERAHFDGMQRIQVANADRATAENVSDVQKQLIQASSMISFLDVNRAKLQKALSMANGSSVDPHPLLNSIEQRYDKQGIMSSILRIPLRERNASTDEYNVSTNSQSDYPQSPLSRQRHKSVVVNGTRNNSFKPARTGTLTAKQMRDMSMGMNNKAPRKQAPLPPQISTKSFLARCQVKYRYDSRQTDELTIEEGEIINLEEKIDGDWWRGELNGKSGIFPAKYVEIIP